MPKLNEIIGYINSQLQVSALTGHQFESGKFYGVAQNLERDNGNGKNDILPCIVTDQDDETWVGIDDIYPFVLYHKNNGILTMPDNKNNYGIPKITMKEIANFTMFIYCDRSKISVTPEDLYAAIVSGMPTSLPISETKLLSLRECHISSMIPDFNSLAVFQSEYKGQQYRLKPNMIFFKINYKIESRYDKTCFNICCNDSNDLLQENGGELLQEDGYAINT